MYLADLSEWNATEANLMKFANDPECSNASDARVMLDAILATRAKWREELLANPFNPRREVSADAKHIAGAIVKHLWIIFVLLPVVLGVLYAAMRQ